MNAGYPGFIRGAVRAGSRVLAKPWVQKSIGSAIGYGANYLANRANLRFDAISRPSPSKRPAMKARIKPRRGAKAMLKYGQQTYGRNLGGKYYKRFRRAKRRKFDKSFNKNGVVYKAEHGSTEATTIANSVYLGHGVAPITLWENIVRALVKKLFAMKGIFIENFDDIVSTFIFRTGSTETEYRIAYFWRDTSDTSAAVSSAQYSFAISTAGVPTTSTWNDLVTALITHIRGSITESSASYGELHFHRFLLSTVDGANVETDASVDCEYLTFDVMVTSHLSLQNRTNDASGSTNILSTTNNPVIGKQYDSNKQWLNGFDLSKTQQGAQSAFFDALYTNGTVGIIATNSVDTFPQLLKKPPQGWQLGVNKQSNVMLQPGAVRDHRLRWKASMKFNTLVQKLQKYVTEAVATGPKRIELGFCTLFGLECMLNDRSELTELQIGWELNQTYMVKCYSGKPPTVPIIVVN